MDIYEAITQMEEIAQSVISEMEAVTAEDLELDPRSSYARLYVSNDCIAANKGEDRTLQYYGGFEYVEKKYRVEIGDYVFYLTEDSRVQDHVSAYFDSFDNQG